MGIFNCIPYGKITEDVSSYSECLKIQKFSDKLNNSILNQFDPRVVSIVLLIVLFTLHLILVRRVKKSYPVKFYKNHSINSGLSNSIEIYNNLIKIHAKRLSALQSSQEVNTKLSPNITDEKQFSLFSDQQEYSSLSSNLSIVEKEKSNYSTITTRENLLEHLIVEGKFSSIRGNDEKAELF